MQISSADKQPPNTRVQRTRSSASRRHSPLPPPPVRPHRRMTDETRDLIRELADRPICRWLLPVGWCVLGASIVVLEFVPKSRSSQVAWWFMLVPFAIAIAAGAFARASWFRWVAVPGGLILLLFFGLISITTLYPQLMVWWLGVVVAFFGLWTLLVGLAGFAEKQRAA